MSHEVDASSHQVAGGTHFCRVDVALGDEASPEKPRDLSRVDPVVLGLGPVNGLRVEGVPEDEGDAFASAEVCEPVPGERALDGDDEILPVRGDSAKKPSGSQGMLR
ncbi:MAG: hypothetical protein GY725_05820 [bacterium]|nr:hypothetical protein [bacterium]